MKNTKNIQVQIESRTLWDVVVAETCGCCELHKPCDILIDDGEYRLSKLACDYKCETAKTRMRYLALLKDNDLLHMEYPVFWKRTAFKKEIDAVLTWLIRWDPNGDWDLYDLLDTPWQTIETLDNLRDELADDYQDVPGWIDEAITYLMVLAQ